jgi:hypothetical protein
MDTPIPMWILGYVVVIFGLCVLVAAAVLFAIFPERPLVLLIVVSLEVIAGLASMGWGTHLIRSDTA